MSIVSIVWSKYTDESRIEEMVQEVLEPLGGLGSFVSTDDKVVLKPNLVTNRKYFTGATTDPLIVQALIRQLKALGVRDITVADSSWAGCSTAKTFIATGIKGIADREGVKLVDLKKDQFENIKITQGIELEGEVRIAKTVLDADKLINLPKLKAHSQTRVTLSLKNLKGCIHDDEKRRFHRVDIEAAIAELNTVLKPDLIVLDAIVGEMTAELGCDPIRLDTVMAGTDPVAVDALCSTILGYEPQEIGHIVNAERFGIGKGLDLNTIEIKGDVELALLKGEVTELIGFQRYSDAFSEFGMDIHAEGACSSCLAALFIALKRVTDDEKLEGLKNSCTYIGQIYADMTKAESSGTADSDKVKCIGIGNCTKQLEGMDIFVPGCPPTALNVYKKLK